MPQTQSSKRPYGPNTAGVSLRMPGSMFCKLKLLSEASNTTMNTLILDAIYNYMADGHVLRQAIVEHEKNVKIEIELLQEKMKKLATIQAEMETVI